MAAREKTQRKVGQRVKKTVSTILILALVAGLFYGYRSLQSYLNRPEVRLVQAERASFNRTLNLNAQVEAQDSQTVASAYGLKVQEVLVQEGDFVSSGQPLYRYSRSDARRQLSKVKESLRALDAKDKERQERFEEIFNEMASELSEQLGVSLQAGAAMLQNALSSFDLKTQLQGLIPGGLEGLGLSKEMIQKTVEILNQALDAGEKILSEIASLIGKINSGISELDKVNYYQLQARLEALGKELQAVHDTAASILRDNEELTDEAREWVQDTIRRAEELQGSLAALNETINQKLQELAQTSPSQPGNSGGIALPTQPAETTETPGAGTESGAGTTGTAPQPEGSSPAPSTPAPAGDSAGGNGNAPAPEATTAPEVSEAATAAASGEGGDTASPTTPVAAAPAASSTPLGALGELADEWGEELATFFRSSLKFWAPQKVLAEEAPLGDLGMALGDGSQMNPAMLLALLQMDRSQGQTEREQLENDQSGLEDLLRGDGLTVKATLDGLVAVLNVQEGEAVERGELETLVLDNTTLIATCWVGKQDASRLEKGQTVVYNYDDLDLYGEIIYKSAIATQEPSALGGLGSQLGLDNMGDLLGKNLGSGSPKVEIRMSIEGPDLRRLTIGFDLNGEVEIGEVHDVLSIPIESLVQERDKYFVYYVDEDQVLREKEIELGLVGEKRVEVKSGLRDGEAIVINAISKLEPGQKVKVVSEDES